MHGKRELDAFICERLTHWFPDLITKPITMLDFGCGSGLLAHFVQRAFYNSTVYAVDTDVASIEYAQEVFPELKSCVVTYDNRLAFEDNFFDLVYAVNVFHHIDRQLQPTVYRELMRVIKPGGNLVIIEFNQLNIKTWWRFKHNPEERTAQLIPFWRWHRLTEEKKASYSFLWNSTLPLSKIPFAPLYAVRIVK